MNILGQVINGVKNTLAERARKQYLKQAPPEPAVGVFERAEPAEDRLYTAGFGKCSIMPDEPIPGKTVYYVAGYRINHPATGILDPMMAKAVYLDDHTGRGGVVFCQIDCVGLLRHDVQIIRARLQSFCEETGCRSINICSTHDHAGIDTMGLWGPLPKTGRNKEHMEKVYLGAQTAILNAYRNRREGALYYGFTEIDPALYRDSRLPEIFSNKLHRIRFVPNDGSREIYLVNFSSHSESLLGDNTLISADFPAYIAAEVEKEKGADMVYTVGAIGGLIMMRPMDDNNILSTKKTGRFLGKKLCEINNDVRLDAAINLVRQEFYVGCDNHVLLAAAKVGIIPAKPVATGVGSGALNQSLLTEMTYMEIGSLKMLLLPGESFPENIYGGYLSADESADGQSPAINPPPLCKETGLDLIVIGLANDEIGYIPPPNDFHLHPDMPYVKAHPDRFKRRHYEETNSLGPQTASRIYEVFHQIMRQVHWDK